MINNEKYLPYYKDWDDNKFEDKQNFQIKIPTNVYEELEKHYKSKFKIFNNSKGGYEIIKAYLNTLCLEKKQFKIDVTVICPNTKIPTKDSKLAYIKSLNYYYLCYKDDNVNFNNIYEKNEYLTPAKNISIQSLTESINNKKYTDINRDIIPYHDSFSITEIENFLKQNGINPKKDIVLKFRLNNYLDTYNNGQYSDGHLSKSYNHIGVSYFKIDDEIIFFIYKWYLDQNSLFKFNECKIITETNLLKFIKDNKIEDSLKNEINKIKK